MATTFPDVVSAMQAAIEGAGLLPVASGVMDDQEQAYSDGTYRVSFPREIERFNSTGVEQQLGTVVSVDAYQVMTGDLLNEAAALLEKLRVVADAIEAGTYPPSTELVVTESRGVTRNPSEPSWLTGTISVRLQWSAAVGG